MKELIKYGKKMVLSGLVDSHFGNVSKRIGNNMLISLTGSMLDELEGEIIEVPVFEDSSIDIIASTEIKMHREIYKRTAALSILHGHSPFAVILSMIEKGKSIKPEDSESLYLLHEIPLVNGGVGTEKLAENVAEKLKEHKGVIIKGHGTVAKGQTVDEAFVILSSIEHSCQLKYYVDLMKKTGN